MYDMNKFYVHNKEKSQLWVTNITTNGTRTDWNDSQYDNGRTVSIGQNLYYFEIICDNGYEFGEIPILQEWNQPSPEPEYVVNEIPFNVNSENTIATMEVDNTDGKGVTIPPTWEVIKITKKHNVTINGNAEIDKTVLEDGEHELTVTPLSGYKLIEVAYSIDSHPNPDDDIGNFDISENGDIATGIIIVQDWQGDVEFNVVTEEVTEPEPEPEPEPTIPLNTFNNLYIVNSTDLRKIKNQLIGVVNEPVPSINDYVINLLYIPFKIPEYIKGETQTVKVGFETFTDVQTETLKNDYVEISLGSVHIPEKYGNSKDYLNTNIFLHSPYNSKIELPIEYVIGHTLTIEYITNFYTGETTVNITSDKTNKVIHSENFMIGMEIPLIRKQGEGVTNNQGVNMNLYNKVRNVFIEVIRNVPYDYGDSMIQEKGNIGDYQGYIRIIRPEIEVDSTLSEKNDIERLLNQGVYING